MHDINEISKMLSEKVEQFCKWLLPNGKVNGNYYEIGSIDGNEGCSLKINLSHDKKPGLWKDFASDDKGGDLINLIEKVKDVKTAEAVSIAKAWLKIKDGNNISHTDKKYTKPSLKGTRVPSEEMIAWFKARHLWDGMLEVFDIAEIDCKDGKAIVFPYYKDRSKKDLCFIKYRPLKNKKGMWSSPNAEQILFGWQAVNSNKEVVICEGELDAFAMSCAGINAVSVPCGGGDGGKQDAWIENEWEHLALFRKIYLNLDKDEQGKKAERYIAKRLGYHRCYICNMPYKDANEAYINNFDFREMLNNAKTLDPEHLVCGKDFKDEMVDFIKNGDEIKGEALPWKKTADIIRIRPGETSVWAGINGHGKSQLLGHVAVASMARGERWMIASMEFKPKKLLTRLCRQYLGTNNVIDNINRTDSLLENIWFYDVQGTADIKDMLESFIYAFRRYGVNHFVVDSLAKCGFDEDGYNQQKKFVDDLSSFARDNDLFVHLVCHSRKKDTESNLPDKFDIKGSGAITDMVDNVFVVWRNKPKEENQRKATPDTKILDQSDCILTCCKQREGEFEGKVYLWFDKASLQYLDHAESMPVNYSQTYETEFYQET